MTAFVSAGSKLSLSKDAPSSFDQTGFESLTYTDIAEIENAGTVGGSWGMTSHTAIDSLGTQDYKTVKSGTEISLSLAFDPTDAGQNMLQEAFDSVQAYSVKITLSTGYIIYAVAKVGSFDVELGTADAITKASANLKLQPQKDGTFWVQVTPVASKAPKVKNV
mgnify:FL=1